MVTTISAPSPAGSPVAQYEKYAMRPSMRNNLNKFEN